MTRDGACRRHFRGCKVNKGIYMSHSADKVPVCGGNHHVALACKPLVRAKTGTAAGIEHRSARVADDFTPAARLHLLQDVPGGRNDQRIHIRMDVFSLKSLRHLLHIVDTSVGA